MLIVALDGLILESMDLRADALHAALDASGCTTDREHLTVLLPGRSLAEVVRAIDSTIDESRLDLIVLQAQQMISRRMASGVDLAPSVQQILDAERALGARIIARSDSLRRDVDRVLSMSGLEHAFVFVRCADDAPRTLGATMIDSAYRAICQRLESAAGVTHIRALEYGDRAAQSASRYVTQAEHVLALA